MPTQQSGGSKSESKLLLKTKLSIPHLPELGMNSTCSIKTRGKRFRWEWNPSLKGAELWNLPPPQLCPNCFLLVRSPCWVLDRPPDFCIHLRQGFATLAARWNHLEALSTLHTWGPPRGSDLVGVGDCLCRQPVNREPEEPPGGFFRETASGIAFLLGLIKLRTWDQSRDQEIRFLFSLFKC